MPVFEDSGKFKGQAFIEFDSVESATKAVEYNNTEVDGRTVWIDFALPRNSAGGRGGGGGRGGRGGTKVQSSRLYSRQRVYLRVHKARGG